MCNEQGESGDGARCKISVSASRGLLLRVLSARNLIYHIQHT